MRILSLWDVTKILKGLPREGSRIDLPISGYVKISGVDVDLVLPLGKQVVVGEDGKIYGYAVLYDCGDVFYAVVFDEDGAFHGVCRDDNVESWTECIDRPARPEFVPHIVELIIDMVDDVVGTAIHSTNAWILWRQRLEGLVNAKLVRKLEKYRKGYYLAPELTYEELKKLVEELVDEINAELMAIREKVERLAELAKEFPEIAIALAIDALKPGSTIVKVMRHGNSNVVATTFGRSEHVRRYTVLRGELECFERIRT